MRIKMDEEYECQTEEEYNLMMQFFAKMADISPNEIDLDHWHQHKQWGQSD